MSLATPAKLRRLQRALYGTAKQEPGLRSGLDGPMMAFELRPAAYRGGNAIGSTSCSTEFRGWQIESAIAHPAA